MSPLDTAIIKTLAYADIFNHALNTTELNKYLIGYELKPSDKIDEWEASNVKRQDNLWTLSGREELLSLKQHQRQTTNDKLQATEKYLWIFRLLPWIKMVGITGSVAGGTPRPDDDIDLLIITDKHRLWLTRLLLTITLNILGKRRKPHADPQRVNNKFCLNMWLSSDNLEERNRDIYVANELAHLIPILNRQHTYELYLQTNAWMKTILPNYKPHLFQQPFPTSNHSESSGILLWCEKLAEKLQKTIMQTPTIETVESARLAFHPHDYRTEILRQFQQKLRQFNIHD